MNDSAQRLSSWGAETAVILGSGLSTIVPEKPVDTVSYQEFPGIPRPSVAGHAGRFALAEIAGTKIIFAEGRVHLYEGYDASEVTAIVRALADAGARNLILTNAAGSARGDFHPGTWMMLSDHINLTGTTPLLGGPNFVDMSAVYSPALREAFRHAASHEHVILHEGVYAGLLGPLAFANARWSAHAAESSARMPLACRPCSRRSRRKRSG